MRGYLPFFVGFAVLWMLQLYGTAKQSQQFMREVSRLRQLGETAIGASSNSRMKRRSYVALASDETDLVTGAVELGGLTVFARATPVPELVGTPLRELADAEVVHKRAKRADRRSNAAGMAARALLGEELERPAPAAQRAMARRERSRRSAGGGASPSVPTAHRSTRSAGHLPSARG